MDGASSKSRKVLDSKGRNEMRQNFRLHETCQLFHNLILATQTHSMEYFRKAKEHRISDTLEQSDCICHAAQNQTCYPVCRPCIISRDAACAAVSPTTPNPESHMARKERSQ